MRWHQLALCRHLLVFSVCVPLLLVANVPCGRAHPSRSCFSRLLVIGVGLVLGYFIVDALIYARPLSVQRCFLFVNFVYGV